MPANRVGTIDIASTPRSLARIGIIAVVAFIIPGCGQDSHRSSLDGQTQETDVENPELERAAKELATSITACMNQLRQSEAGASDIYAVVLVVFDDFSDVQVYANTESYFATKDGSNAYRWYFGEFWFEGLPVNVDALTTHLGEVEDWGDDEKPENSNAVDWLVTMTLAMRYAQNEGAFVFGGKNATVYCSMVDSLNAIWLEDLSARFLNDADTYTDAAEGIKAASADWYQSGDDQGSSAFRAAYEARLP